MNGNTHPFIQSIEHGHIAYGDIIISYNPAGPDHIAKVQVSPTTSTGRIATTTT